jgi:hypothetical protein
MLNQFNLVLIKSLCQNQNLSMAFLGNAPVVPNIGFNPVANLPVPSYILSETVTFQDRHGVFHLIRRPRPLSLVASVVVILQSDQDLLRQ